MGIHVRLQTPEQFELLEFFEAPPLDEVPQDGFWSYEVVAPEGWKLLFSFNVFERWLKTQVVVQEAIVEEVVQEGATRLWIEQRPQGQVLVGECEFGLAGKCRLEIFKRPAIAARWRTLVG